jgi:hypothetical protein
MEKPCPWKNIMQLISKILISWLHVNFLRIQSQNEKHLYEIRISISDFLKQVFRNYVNL